MIKAQLLNKGSYYTRVVTIKTRTAKFIGTKPRVVTCWTGLQKEKCNVKDKFIFICRVEVYTKAREMVNKTNCSIVRFIKVTVSNLLCSFYSCLCWFHLWRKERRTAKILNKRLQEWRCFCAGWEAVSHRFYRGSVKNQHHGRSPPATHGPGLPHPQCQFIFTYNKRMLYCVA